MIGYALGNKTGAFLYNLFHHKGIALLIYGLGCYFSIESFQLAGIILFSHSEAASIALSKSIPNILVNS